MVDLVPGQSTRSPTGEAALIPVRCYSCGKVISHVWEEYRERIKTEPPGKVLDDLGIDKYCCRRMLLSHVEIVDTLRRYQ